MSMMVEIQKKNSRRSDRFLGTVFLFMAWIVPPAGLCSQDVIPFRSERWTFDGADTLEYLGRAALAGNVLLKDAEFTDGIIEVDLAVNGATSYPGVVFRQESPGNYERVYLRPHRSGLYPDAVQYVAAFNGLDSWQFYNGDGLSAPSAKLPVNEWFRLKIEVKGTQARVFIGDSEDPVFLIHNLKRGKSSGTIGLMGPRNRSAYFSNFRYREDHTLVFDPPPRSDVPPGIITDWQISQPLKAELLTDERNPLKSKGLPGIVWKDVKSDPGGLVDISRHFGRLGASPDAILARTTIQSDKDRIMKLRFGYSDEVYIYCNGRPVFTGNSAYRLRDPSFLGIAGFFDAVYLPLKRGSNEILLMVNEVFGGWGFMVQDGDAVHCARGVEKLWETDPVLKIPESAAYDPARKCIYVSNYDGYNPSTGDPAQSIAKLTSEGKLVKADWLPGVSNPTGLEVRGDVLRIVEPKSLVEVDIPGEKVIRRIPIPGAAFLNDVASAPDGTVFISDSRRNIIFAVKDGKAEEWLKNPEIGQPNGLLVHQGSLLVGNNADGFLKAVDLNTRMITRVANLGNGVIDGIAADRTGAILVSHNEGRIFRVSGNGDVEKILDTTVQGTSAADFCYVPDIDLLVVPEFVMNRVAGYKIKGAGD